LTDRFKISVGTVLAPDTRVFLRLSHLAHRSRSSSAHRGPRRHDGPLKSVKSHPPPRLPFSARPKAMAASTISAVHSRCGLSSRCCPVSGTRRG